MYRSYSRGLRPSIPRVDQCSAHPILLRRLGCRSAFSIYHSILIAANSADQRPHTEPSGDSSGGLVDANVHNLPWPAKNPNTPNASDRSRGKELKGTSHGESTHGQNTTQFDNAPEFVPWPLAQYTVQHSLTVEGTTAPPPRSEIKQMRPDRKAAFKASTSERKRNGHRLETLSNNPSHNKPVRDAFNYKMDREQKNMVGIQTDHLKETRARREYNFVQNKDRAPDQELTGQDKQDSASQVDLSKFGAQEVTREMFREQMSALEDVGIESIADEEQSDTLESPAPVADTVSIWNLGISAVRKLTKGMGAEWTEQGRKNVDHNAILGSRNVRQAMMAIKNKKDEKVKMSVKADAAINAVFFKAAGMAEEAAMSESEKTQKTEEMLVFDSDIYDQTEVEFIDVDELSIRSEQLFIPPGSICEIKFRAAVPHFAVYLMAAKGYPGNAYFLTGKGEIILQTERQVRFALPNFVAPASIRQILVATRDRAEVPRDLTTPIVQEIRQFEAGCDRMFNENQTKLGTLWELLSDEKEVTTITTFEAARPIFGKTINNMQLYATHRSLIMQPFHFRPDSRKHRSTALWTIVSIEENRNGQQVVDWFREWQEDPAKDSPIAQFVSKCRRIIDRSRAYRKDPEFARKYKAGEVITEHQVQKGFLWSKTDQIIIKVMYKTTVMAFPGMERALDGIYPSILLALDRYGDDQLDGRQLKLGPVCSMVFLSEIGAITPWLDEREFQTELALPGHHVSRAQDMVYRLFQKIDNDSNSVEKLGFKDVMADIRHDWGDLRVYCIDAAGSKEIDDGISVERIPGSDDLWLRVHIANPSAFVPEDHWLIENAKQRVLSYYGPERHYPMFPASLVNGLWSLAPNKPVLTVSCRVNILTGDIVEHDIRNGFIRKVRSITYDQVNKLLGSARVDTEAHFTNRPGQNPWDLARKKPEIVLPDDLLDVEYEDIKLLEKVSLARDQLRRNTSSLMIYNDQDLKIEIDDGRGNNLMPEPGATKEVSIYRGYPMIDYSLHVRGEEATRIVAESMLAAGLIVGKWGVENNLPLPYRSWTSTDAPEQKEFYTRLARKAQDKENPLDFSVDGLFDLKGATVLSMTKHDPHELLGLEMYVKITSPLRRYSDLLGHYLIEAKLLEKHEGIPMAPLNVKELEEQCGFIRDAERVMALSINGSERGWLARYMATAQDHEGLPKMFECMVITPGRAPMQSAVKILDLEYWGARLFVDPVAFPGLGDLEKGDICYARLNLQNDQHLRTELISSIALMFAGFKERVRDRKKRAYEAIGMEIPPALRAIAGPAPEAPLGPYLSISGNDSSSESGSNTPGGAAGGSAAGGSAAGGSSGDSSSGNGNSGKRFIPEAVARPISRSIAGSEHYLTLQFIHDPKREAAEVMSNALLFGSSIQPQSSTSHIVAPPNLDLAKLSILVDKDSKTTHQYEDAQYINLHFAHDGSAEREVQRFPNPFFVGSVNAPSGTAVYSNVQEYDDTQHINLSFTHDAKPAEAEQMYPNPFFVGTVSAPSHIQISGSARDYQDMPYVNLNFQHDVKTQEAAQTYPNPFFAGSVHALNGTSVSSHGSGEKESEGADEPGVKTGSGNLSIFS